MRIASFYGVVTAAAVLWGALRGQPNVLIYQGAGGGSLGAAQVVSSAAFGIAIGLLLVLFTRFLSGRYAFARMLHNEFHHVLGPLTQREIVLLAAASAIGEECLFRGALLQHMLAAMPGTLGTVVGLVGSAAVFALLHIGPGVRFLPWTLSSLGVGVLLGVLLIGMGDLIGPIAVHFTVNLLNMRDITRRQLPA